MRTRIRSRALAVGAALAIGTVLGASAPAGAGAEVAVGSGTFVDNPGFVPTAADPTNPAIGVTGRVHVVVNDGDGGTSLVNVDVDGLPAGRSFGAHLHRDPCASAFGGPHYQAPDPAAPSAANADPGHEVWLDFTTNAVGHGRAHAVVPFEVLAGSRSVVIHQGEHTQTGGVAGARLACLDVSI